MYSAYFYTRIFRVAFLFVCFYLVPVHAQRLTASRYSLFNRLLNPSQVRNRNFITDILLRPSQNSDAVSVPPETFLSTPEIIRFHGYPVEEHQVETADGYIISIFRIPHSQNQVHDNSELKSRKTKEPVLIQHGFTCTSDDFLLIHKDNILHYGPIKIGEGNVDFMYSLTAFPVTALAYLLSNSGHNVWLGNFRGSKFGKGQSSSSNGPVFVDFSDDDAVRDISTIVKYILEVENVPQLSYVCHSLGCALIAAAVSDDPGLNDLVKKASFMAPGPYNVHQSSPLVQAVRQLPIPFLLTFSQRYTEGRLTPPSLSLLVRKQMPGVCFRENTRHFCRSAFSAIAGWNPGQITNETLVKVFGHFPADTSMKLVVHALQVLELGSFQKYDYGTQKNLEFYGTTESPLYNLSRVVFPVQGFYGLGDINTPPKDVSRTWSELGNVVETIQVENEKWSHMDFLYGKDARNLVYEKIIQFLST